MKTKKFLVEVPEIGYTSMVQDQMRATAENIKAALIDSDDDEHIVFDEEDITVTEYFGEPGV